MRTPKARGSSGLTTALRATAWESSLAITALSLAVTLLLLRFSLPVTVLAVLALWQGSIYLASPEYALAGFRSEAGNALALQRRAASRGRRLGQLVTGRTAQLTAGLIALTTVSLLYFKEITPVPAEPPLAKLAEIAPLPVIRDLPQPEQGRVVPIVAAQATKVAPEDAGATPAPTISPDLTSVEGRSAATAAAATVTAGTKATASTTPPPKPLHPRLLCLVRFLQCCRLLRRRDLHQQSLARLYLQRQWV